MTFTILAPPSRGMAVGGEDPPWHPDLGCFGAALGGHRRAVAAALAGIDGGDARFLGLSGERLEQAASANRSLVGAATLPAAERYAGVVFDALEPSTIANPQNLVVVSAALGLVGMADPVPQYRLAGKDSIPGLGTLKRFWPDRLRVAYAKLARPVIDLTSLEYERLLPADPERIRVDIVRSDGKPAGHWGKVAKGLLIRKMLAGGADPIAVAEGFEHDGLRAAVG